MQVLVSDVIKSFQSKTGKIEFWLSFSAFLIKKEQEKVSFGFYSKFF